jgi:uncharacterized membrane protein
MSQQLVLDSSVEAEKQTARLLYIFHGLTFFFSFGLLSFIPLILNYVKRPYAEGTMVYSHHTWMIRSFWYYLLWIVVGGAMWATIILFWLGWLMWGVAWLWKAYRLIRARRPEQQPADAGVGPAGPDRQSLTAPSAPARCPRSGRRYPRGRC